jgi:arginase
MSADRIELFGVPSSMGAFAPGQERAPQALREAGLPDRLQAAGFDLQDQDDASVRRWFPDRTQPRAQHVEAVAAVARETAERVAAAEGLALVLGGDCTIGLGTVAGIQAGRGGRAGLLYFDLHPDMNVPSSVSEGALDWMGMAHALGIEGAESTIVKAFERTPLLEPDELWLFAHGPGTEFEREQIARLGVRGTTVTDVARDPEGSAATALDEFIRRADHLVVHLDVDVIDFVDLPLSQDAGRNEGLLFDAAMRALGTLLAHPAVAALTVTEINPAHDPDGSQLPRFVEGLVGAFSDGRAPAASS